MKLIKAIATVAACVAMTWSGSASALAVKLDYVWGGNGGGTTVFIHGHGNCIGGNGSDSRCVNLPYGYWLNSTEDGGDGHDFMAEATSKCTASGCSMSCASTGCNTINYYGSWSYSEAFAIRYDMVNQSMMASVNDVANCLLDLKNGTNTTGCNPSLYKRTSFRVVGHSAGGAVIDRIFSTGSWPGLTGTGGAIVGNPVASAGALAGSRAASALYGTDGASNFCTTLISWVAGWALKSAGNASLTRGSLLGEANNGRAGKSPRWIYKITTAGGSGSANNNGTDSIQESTNDTKMGILVGCVGYSADDDTDGVLWMYDSDPTSNPAGSNGGKYRSQYTGYYWHWVPSWSNHSHNRNDAYVKKYGFQNYSGCYYISPGTCIGQYAQ
jgi:pimeloyl-ACP methyl ester carboxylesterase